MRLMRAFSGLRPLRRGVCACAVRVDHAGGVMGAAAVAARRANPGDVLMTIRESDAEVRTEPSKFTIHIGRGRHLYAESVMRMNHSFEPTIRLELPAQHTDDADALLVLVADRKIEPGDPITFDYNTTEWEMAEPFACAGTGRQVRGFKHLSAPEREAMLGRALPHIRERAGRG